MKNYKVLTTFLFMFILQLHYSQRGFNEGYEKGFKAGFCHDQVGCISPPTPIPEINVNDSFDSFTDGYNRGFKDGLNTPNRGDRERYKTTKPTTVDFSRKPNPNNQLLLALLKKKKETEEKLNEYFSEVYSEIEDFPDQGSKYKKDLKDISLAKIRNLIDESADILKRTRGNYQYLVDQLEVISADFYDKIDQTN